VILKGYEIQLQVFRQVLCRNWYFLGGLSSPMSVQVAPHQISDGGYIAEP